MALTPVDGEPDRSICDGFEWLLSVVDRKSSVLKPRVVQDIAEQKEQEEKEKLERKERVRLIREERWQ